MSGGLFAWTMAFCVIMLGGTVWNFISPWSEQTWSLFWHVVSVILPVVIAVVTGIWFTWGGISDTIDLFRRLSREQANPLDNGAVIDHHNLDEKPLLARTANDPLILNQK